MKILNYIKLIILVCFLTLLGCNKEDNSTDIVVDVKLIDENEYPIPDNSGVSIIISREQEKFYGKTDSKGECIFYDFPYGNFKVELEKSGFISEYIAPELTSHNGDSLNVHSFKMLEIPQYHLSIDSIRKISLHDDDRMVAKGKINNTKGLPKIQYSAIAYFNSTNKVSKDDYLFYHFVSILNNKIIGISCEYRITNWTNTYLVAPAFNTLYVRLYPKATYPEWVEIREGAFGAPSDVFEWLIQK